MNTTVNALKGLYVVLGGNAEDVENITLIPDMITAFENIDGLTAATKLSGVITKNALTGAVAVNSTSNLLLDGAYVDIGNGETSEIYLHPAQDKDIIIQYGTSSPSTLENYIKSVVQSMNQ